MSSTSTTVALPYTLYRKWCIKIAIVLPTQDNSHKMFLITCNMQMSKKRSNKISAMFIRFGVVVSALVWINEVNLRRARLVLRWVTVSGVQSPVPGNLSQYITSHPGQLSLAIPLWVGVMSTSQRAVMPCGLGVKAGMVREWVAGKTVWSPCYHGPYLSALAMGSSHNMALYKCPITLLYLLYSCFIFANHTEQHWIFIFTEVQ